MLLKKSGLLSMTAAIGVAGASFGISANEHQHQNHKNMHHEAHQEHHQQMPAKGIKVHMGWSRALPPVVKTGAAYLMIHNYSAQSNAIVGAHSDVADKVEIHTSEQGTDGMVSMEQLSRVEIKPGGAVTFKPGATHLMLLGLKQPLKAGEEFPLYLKMAEGGDVKVMITIKGGSDQSAHQHHGHHH